MVNGRERLGSSIVPERPVPFARGFPMDWPMRPANFFQLDWLAHTRNFIQVWMPETVTAGESILLFILREVVSFHFSSPWRGLWVHTFEKPRTLFLQGRWRAIPEGVELSLNLTNLSSEVWENVNADVCVQLVAAPDFADFALERTFSISNRRLVPAAQPASRQTVTHEYKMGERATENFIAVGSRTPGYVVAQWWEGPPQVGGNCHPSIACVHAVPSYGRIEPGQTVLRSGRLYLMRGTVADAWKRYQKERIESGKA